MPRLVRLLPACAVLLAGAAASAQVPQAPAPRPAAPPRPPAAVDPVFEAARAAFEARPEAERKAVQDALVWVSDYNSVTSGAFGRRTFEGITGWQTQTGAEPTGQLDDRARARLLAAGQAARQAAKFSVETDANTGIVLGVPERLLSRRSRIPNGTRWQSADGRVTLDTKAYAPGESDLDALFERAAAVTPERKVTYKLKKPDFVVVTGETAAGKFYIRYAAASQGVRGFTLAYDKALAREVDRLMIAVANSFAPFPADAPVAAGPRPADAPPAATPTAAAVAATTVAATALVVAPRRAVTAASALGACATPLVGGAPARLLRQEAGLALLDAGAAVRAGSLAAAPGAPEGEVVVVAASREGGASVTTGTAGPGGLAAPLQPGAAGAPVLDRAGRLVGLVARMPAQPRLVAGVMPPMTHPVAGLDALRGLLGAEGAGLGQGQEAAPRSVGAAAGPVAALVLPVTCRP
ncbi:serine protease [Methylobacterium oryzisoli]|uniref:serine protease n=1 Tax=Methylobacterium oryzisoli TaxID=3385502 RepID=UPI0038912E03